MRLGLSSAAAPDLSLEALVAACLQRGLAALELDAGHWGHLMGGDARAACAAGVPLVGLRVRSLESAVSAGVPSLSRELDAPVIAPAPPPGTSAPVLEAGRRYSKSGGRLLLSHRTDPRRMEELRKLVEREGSGTLALAWSVEPSTEEGLAAQAPEMLESAGGALAHIRLSGGGPESALQEGRGVGQLFAHLALSGWAGTLVLAPSTPLYLRAWGHWLGRNGGWGCGSKVAGEPLPLVLSGAGVE